MIDKWICLTTLISFTYLMNRKMGEVCTIIFNNNSDFFIFFYLLYLYVHSHLYIIFFLVFRFSHISPS